MKKIKKESGYALLMVLMLIILFTVLGMGLMATNMNSAKQFSMKENQVQARHQAEMGVLHYSAILEDKIKSTSASNISCNDINALLGTGKKITAANYSVEPANPAGSTCKEMENGKLLEIKIKSKGIINGETEKQVEATFFATNQGVASAAPPAGGIIAPPPIPNSTDTDKKTVLAMKKDFETFPGNLIIQDKLDIGGGNTDILKVHKDLYIAGLINIQNHACISSGGDFTAKQDFNWGNSKTSLLVRKDAYLPSVIGNWQKNQVNVYIFGNLYLPITYNYPVNKAIDRNLYVGGKVFQLKNISSTEKKYIEVVNPFKKLEGLQKSAANSLSCSVPASKEEAMGIPKWILQDEKIVNYN